MALNNIKTAAKSAVYNIVLQVLLRISTFVLNAFILRYLSRDVLGVINVRLTLLYSTTQFLSRESFRRACLTDSDSYSWKHINNLIWLTIPVTVLWGAVFRFVWLHLLDQPVGIDHYFLGVDTVLACVFLEMVAEPLFIYGQMKSFIKLKVVIEGLSLMSRTICMAVLLFLYPQLGVKAFCYGQILCSCLYTILYYGYFLSQSYLNPQTSTPSSNLKMSMFLPKFSFPIKTMFSLKLAHLTWSFFKQTLVKQVLTEGEKYVMTLFKILSFAQQGVYDVVNNLGSLAARFIFLPIEESSYLLFGQLIQRDLPASKQKKENLNLCQELLLNLIKIMILLGLIILTFGQSYSKLLLKMYGGDLLSLSEGPTLLRSHCLYILFIAVNGVSEAFVFAAMNKDQIERYNKKMVLLSAAFLLVAYGLTISLGSVGFILANCFNMGGRILHSAWFLENYFQSSGLKFLSNLQLDPLVLVSLVASFFITLLSEGYLFGTVYKYALHVILGGVCLVTVVLTIYFKERQMLNFVKQHWKTTSPKKED